MVITTSEASTASVVSTFGALVGDVDADLGHGLDRGRVDLVAGQRPGRAHLDGVAGQVRAASRRPSGSGRRCARRRTGRWASRSRVSPSGTAVAIGRSAADDDGVGDGGDVEQRTTTTGGAADELHRRTNIGTDAGAMPAKVSDSVRATSIIGLAKLVDERPPVGRGDVGADRERRQRGAAGADQREDQHDQAEGGQGLGQPQAAGRAVGRGRSTRRAGRTSGWPATAPTAPPASCAGR